MKTCGECVYYLSFKCEGYNCGYFIRTVNRNGRACAHFRPCDARTEES